MEFISKRELKIRAFGHGDDSQRGLNYNELRCLDHVFYTPAHRTATSACATLQIRYFVIDRSRCTVHGVFAELD